MKNVIFIMLTMLLLATGINSVQAQRPVGDTLSGTGADTTYYPGVYDYSLEWRTSLTDFLNDGRATDWSSWCPIGSYCNGNLREGNQFYTDRPLKVVGVAACGRALNVYYERYGNCPRRVTCHDDDDTFLCIIDTTLAGRRTDSLILYTFSSNGEPMYLTGGPWRVEYPHRHMTLPRRQSSATAPLCYLGDNDSSWYYQLPVLADLYEVMFDKPRVVTDSFIVVGTANNNELIDVAACPDNYTTGERLCLWEYRPTRYWSVFVWSEDPEPNMITWIKLRNYEWERDRIGVNYPDPNGYGYYPKYFNIIIPIIDPDFDTVLCDAVRDVQLAAATDTTLTLIWTGGNNVEWEVQYAEMNGSVAWTVTTTVPMVTLTGLHERTNYVVRVRGKCEWDTEFGPWSDWTDVFTGAHHDDPPESISNLERFTRMMPNPASDQVTVLSSYRLSRVVVYDLRGHAVLEHDGEGLAATIDVSTLAKGIYVVAIHTPAGTATKRLVVE